jgi:hypothetical protein
MPGKANAKDKAAETSRGLARRCPGHRLHHSEPRCPAPIQGRLFIRSKLFESEL